MATKRLLQVLILQLLFRSVMALSLANFQAIPKTVTVPVTCALIYDSTIPSCTKSDFSNGAACSTSCIQGLQSISTSVNEACGGVTAPSNSLLGIIFQGGVVAELCPNIFSKTSASASSSTPPSKQTVQSSTANPPSTTQKSTSTQALAGKTSTTSTLNSQSSSTPSSNSASSSSTSSATSSSAASPASSSGRSNNKSSSTATSSSDTVMATAQPVTEPNTKGMSAQQVQILALANTGGGSPFDIFVGSSASRQLERSSLVLLTKLLAIFWAGFLLIM